MINEKIKKIQEGGCSSLEIKLMAICLVLIGIVIGLVISPPKFFTAGSFNGNGNGNSGCIGTPEEFMDMIKTFTEKKCQSEDWGSK